MTDNPDDTWMSTDNLCAWLEVNRDWVYDKINEIPHVKVGRLLRFNKREVTIWLEKHRQVNL